MAAALNNVDGSATILNKLVALREKYPSVTSIESPDAKNVLGALREFDACVRYLNTRRSTGAIIEMGSEGDVQDVLYLLLRPWVHDLSYESPGDKTANRFAIKDFASASGRFVIDAKFIRNRDHGKSISKELHDDIEMYRSHPKCDDLIFFIFDPELWIPDQRALVASIEIERTYGQDNSRRLRCHVVIK